MSINPSMSHGTQVEQSRAVAEVFAAAELATRFPRDEQRAEQRMLAACARRSLAEGAEYALPRSGGKDVTGPTVGLARELARIWGNITHGVVEISRNHDLGQSELLAYAWDVESNTRSARTFIVPHTRDKSTYQGKKKTGTQQVPIDTQQDITNQNNSVGARQLRESIYSVLPQWFTEDAIAACKATLVRVEQTAINSDEPGNELYDRVATAIRTFTDQGITQHQLEQWAGTVDRPLVVGQWTAETLARVGVLWRSLASGQAKVDDVFPPVTVALTDIPAAAPEGPIVQPAEFGQPTEPSDLDLEPTPEEIARSEGFDRG